MPLSLGIDRPIVTLACFRFTKSTPTSHLSLETTTTTTTTHSAGVKPTPGAVIHNTTFDLPWLGDATPRVPRSKSKCQPVDNVVVDLLNKSLQWAEKQSADPGHPNEG
mmetsp:Transcript_35822/g.63980  ORF Transcript_35822/g.63980 Transcript_35822/m.63980 type:complete len:108 (+) Transcript_35822:493-816(+)